MIGMLMMSALFGCTAKDSEDTDDALPRRALVIGIDGVRADAFAQADTPSFDTAFAEGVLTLEASTQLTGVTVSGPGWTSILTGHEVEDHGVIENDALLDRALPTFPELLQSAGTPAAVIAHWQGIVQIVGADHVDHMEHLATDAEVGAALLERLEDDDHDVIFAHFDDVDHAGHSTGFSTENPNYIAAIEGVDAYAAEALARVAADTAHQWLIVLCTDHGGSGLTHGTMDDENRTIPLAMTGGAVHIPENPNHMDVAVTVMDWFGGAIDAPDGQSWLD